MPPARQGCVHSQKIKLWFTDSRILSPSDLQLLILGLCYKWLWGLNQKKLEVGETRKDFSVSSFLQGLAVRPLLQWENSEPFLASLPTRLVSFACLSPVWQHFLLSLFLACIWWFPLLGLCPSLVPAALLLRLAI